MNKLESFGGNKSHFTDKEPKKYFTDKLSVLVVNKEKKYTQVARLSALTETRAHRGRGSFPIFDRSVVQLITGKTVRNMSTKNTSLQV